MRNNRLALALLAALSLPGCASLTTPTTASLKNVPVVQFGDPVPKNGDFILHFAAGQPIPVVTSITGSALAKSDERTLHVTLARDIYAYKHYVSFDDIHWQPAKQALGFHVEIKIPSPGHPEAGKMALRVDLK